MVNELLGIQYNIAKANVTDRKVQNLASYINSDSLRAIHRTMDKNKASQRRSYTWDTFNHGLLRTFPLLEPSIKVSLFYR